jgi:hypothetical protein
MEPNPVPQEAEMWAKPQPQHQWLQKFVGEWTYETEASMGADQPPAKATGTTTVRALGEVWILAEGHGEMPGGIEAHTLMTLGYDSQKQRYVGTWIGSMMDYLWLYDGELDAATQSLALDSEGPAMTGDGTMAKYRDVVEFKGDAQWSMVSHVLNENGQWHPFMTIDYRRQS